MRAHEPPKQKWTVLWSHGPYDNPDDGEFEVEAAHLEEATALAGAIVDPWEIDGIIRTDLWKDLS